MLRVQSCPQERELSDHPTSERQGCKDCSIPWCAQNPVAALSEAVEHTRSGQAHANAHRGERRPLDEDCDCQTCRQHSRAYLHALARRGLPAGAIAVTFHNVAYMQRLGRDIRAAIMEHRYPEYVRMFVRRHHPDGAVPQWIRTGLELAGIELDAL